MFWEIFYKLCIEKGTKPSAVCAELKFSNATATKWKKGSIPSTESLNKIAEYFNVSVDYFLGKTEIRTTEIKTINDNHGVIGDTHAPVTINNGMVLGEIEREILNVCAKLGIKEKNALLSKAYELLENIT